MQCPEVSYLEKITGTRWTGIRFCRTCRAKQIKIGTLCEAVARSFTEHFCLPAGECTCPGALRSLGYTENEKKMAGHISRETGADMACVSNIIACSPRMGRPVSAVELGNAARPALCAGYISPEAAMKLLRKWQMTFGRELSTKLSSFMAVCSAVVTAYTDFSLVFSMGCPESRRRGGIARDRLFAALPRTMVTNMMKELPECQHMNTSAQPAVIALSSSKR